MTNVNPVKQFKSPDGTIRYVKDSKLHNSEGPALIHPNGKEEYYLNGIFYTKEDFKKRKKEGTGLPWYKSSVGKMRH